MIIKSESKRIKLINAIEDYLEDHGSELREKDHGFLEDIQINWLQQGRDISQKQYDWVTDLIGFDWL